MIKSYNQFCCGQSNILYFDTTFTSPSHALQNYDIDSLFSAIYYEHSSPVMIMTTTIPVTYVATSSAVRTTTSNELPSAMTIDDIYFKSIFKYILTSYESPSTVIKVSPAVSIADEAISTVTKTPTVSYHSSNYFSLILRFESSRQFNQITLVFLRLLSLYRTLHLFITSLLLLISNPYFDTISC